MNKLFVWRNTLGRKLKGVPQNSIIWLLDNKPKGTLNDNSIQGKWIQFNPYQDDIPLGNELKMPKELYLYLNVKSQPVFDWCYVHHHIMVVSEKFLNFLLENISKEQIEISKLSVYNTDNVEFNQRKYFAIRVIKFNDDSFNFNSSIKKRAAGARGRFMYPEIELKAKIENQNIYFLLEFCYNECLIITNDTKDYILLNFHNPEIYKIEDYPLVYNHSSNLSGLPKNITQF